MKVVINLKKKLYITNILKKVLSKIFFCFYGIKKYDKNAYIGMFSQVRGGINIKIGKNASIRPYAFINCNKNTQLTIGDNTDIGRRTHISVANRVIIGNNVLFGPNVFVSDHNHRYDQVGVPIIDQGIDSCENSVIIEDDVWIGINCVIVGNVRIGRGAVIGANAVVNKNIPEYSVAAGLPAKVIKTYDRESGSYVKFTN